MKNNLIKILRDDLNIEKCPWQSIHFIGNQVIVRKDGIMTLDRAYFFDAQLLEKEILSRFYSEGYYQGYNPQPSNKILDTSLNGKYREWQFGTLTNWISVAYKELSDDTYNVSFALIGKPRN